jgi:hypothetical protein
MNMTKIEMAGEVNVNDLMKNLGKGMRSVRNSMALGAVEVVSSVLKENITRADQAEQDRDEAQALLGETERTIESLKAELNEYKRQGGTVNMERSWKTKYRNGLAEANRRLRELDQEPVSVHKNENSVGIVYVKGEKARVVEDPANPDMVIDESWVPQSPFTSDPMDEVRPCNLGETMNPPRKPAPPIGMRDADRAPQAHRVVRAATHEEWAERDRAVYAEKEARGIMKHHE